MSENQVNPDYVDTPYEASGWIRRDDGSIVWFVDKEVARDPMLGIKVRRTNMDTGELICNYVLEPAIAHREATRPARSIRFYQARRRKRLANAKPFNPDRDAFTNMPTPTKDAKW